MEDKFDPIKREINLSAFFLIKYRQKKEYTKGYEI